MAFKFTFVLLFGAVFISSAAEKPNVLLIMADDVGSDAIGCYGGQSYPTPHIDALATGGMKFNHGYSMPVCHPSRICLMTGRYPSRFGPEGSMWGDYPAAAEGISIGDVMRKGGYATAVAGKWQLCMMKDDLLQPARTGFDEWALFGWHEGGRFHDPYIYENGELRNDTSGQYGPDFYTDFLLDFMERSHDEGKPFFAYYPMALCHDVTDDLKDKHVSYFRDGRWMNYAEMMGSMDDMVGRLIRGLERIGARKNTLVIFTTDNGTPQASYLYVDGNGKMVRPKVLSIQNGKIVPGGKKKFDDTGTRVPLIANWPEKIKAGSVVDEMADLTDLLPTVAEVAGLEDRSARDGISYAPVLFGEKREAERPWIYIELKGKRCVRSLNWKLYDNGGFYDLSNDPLEKSPLKDDALMLDAREKRAELQKALDGLTGPLE